MTEPGNTFESNQAAQPDSEEMNTQSSAEGGNIDSMQHTEQGDSPPLSQGLDPASPEPDATESTDVTASDGSTDVEPTSTPETEVSIPSDVAPSSPENGADAESPTPAEGVGTSETTTADNGAPDASTEDTTAAGTSDPDPAATSDGQAANGVTADTATSNATPSESVESEPSTSEEGGDHREDGGSRRGKGGRQLPKLSDEEMLEIWNELVTKKNSGQEIDLEVISVNRGGVVSQYRGVEVFLPISHWSLDRHSGQGSVMATPGETVQAHVLEITAFETDARRVTATRRTLLRRGLMTTLEVGQRMTGRVVSILDFGAFVDLGGVDGLVHASEISYDRTKRPNEILNKGDEVDVIIREIDRAKKRIYLGMKELQPSPWDGIEEQFEVGSIRHGKVVGIGKDGVFVEVAPGIEGYIRASELSWTKRVNNPREILQKGEEIDVKVLETSARRQRLGLSYRQAQDDPWPMLSEKFAVDTRWEGEIREISNKGVVVAVEEVEGFLPRSRMGRESRRLPDMKTGEKLPVYVIEIDPEGHSLIFGLSTAQDEGSETGGEESRGLGDTGRGGDTARGGERRGGGGGGGERRTGGGGRTGGRERRGDDGFRGDDRGDRRAPAVTASNEIKSAGNASSFALGDMIGDAIKKRLNYSSAEDVEQPAANTPKSDSSSAKAPVAEHTAEQPSIVSDTASAPPESAPAPVVDEPTPSETEQVNVETENVSGGSETAESPDAGMVATSNDESPTSSVPAEPIRNGDDEESPSVEATT